jgi:lipopolysaccharide/colanic/teichoic acid biosynthesis glycosyltransferase
MTVAKRTLDIVLSAAGLILASPLFLVVGLLIKAEDGGSVFFQHERIGRYGRPFLMWKFRTMVPNARMIGPELTLAGDQRITPIGRWLRRQKFDELPQLFNVLVGEMTLVGPRPEVPKYVAMYTPEQRIVLELAPGITDEASIAYADEGALLANAADPERLYIDQIIPDKIRINLEYARQATFVQDVRIIVATVRHCASSPGRNSRDQGSDHGNRLTA